MTKIFVYASKDSVFKKISYSFYQSDFKASLKLLKTEKEFLSLLKKVKHGIIVVDQTSLNLQDLNAIKLRNKFAPFIPLIVIIKNSKSNMASKYISAGAFDFITLRQISFLPHIASYALKYQNILKEKFFIAPESSKKNESVLTSHKMFEALKETEERFRLAFENSAIAKTISKFDGTILKANKAFCSMVGYSEDELISKNILSITHPDDVTENIRIVKSLLELPEHSKHFEKRYIHKNGKIIWASVSAIVQHDKLSGNVFLTSEVQDITEKKLVAEALEKSEEKFHKAFMNIPEGLSITRLKDGKIIEVNDRFIEVFQFSRDEVIGKTTVELNLWVNHEDRKKFAAVVANRGSVKSFEVIWHKKNGEIIPLLCSANLIEINNEKLILTIAQDISEKKLTEQKLIEAKEKAEEMNRLKASFLSNMSHELRTPMTGILGISEILKGEIKDPDIHMLVNSLQNSAKRLHETLNLIMELSQIDSGRLEILKSSVNLYDFAVKTLEVHRHLALKKNINLELNVNCENEFVEIDDRICGEIINNLVGNAVKYTKKGSITVNVKLDVNKKQKLLLISVKDTGIGISQNKLQNIFDEFRQESEGYNRMFEGTGLGLTVTKKLVEALNGSISVKSKVGKGTTFSLILPI